MITANLEIRKETSILRQELERTKFQLVNENAFDRLAKGSDTDEKVRMVFGADNIEPLYSSEITDRCREAERDEGQEDPVILNMPEGQIKVAEKASDEKLDFMAEN